MSQELPPINPRVENRVVTTTSENPRAVKIKTSSTAVLPQNLNRNGLNLLNDSANNIYISLEETAELHKDLILFPGGSWDGIISGKLWLGQVNGIAASESNLLVTEV